jgi:hypothetical protein
MTRRIIACAVVGAFLLCGAVAVADDVNEHRRMPTIAGTWLVKVVFKPGTEMETKLQYLQTFNEDGRTTLLLPFGGPKGYMETGDTRVGCMGEWKHRAHAYGRVFDIMLLCLLTQEWVPTGDNPTSYQELQVNATLQKEGMTWKGPFVISSYKTDGTQFFTGPGEMEATRIGIKPLP